MEKIEHSHLEIRGLNLHIAHIGNGEKGTVVFIHGFPEIWYTWRHQMLAVAEAGYRAIAPDIRGYGLSDQPKELGNASWQDLILDLLAILDSLQISKAFMVGKDFGAKPAYDFALHHPDRVSGVVTLGIPFSPKGIDFDLLPKGFYISRWREPGRAEADFGRFDVKTVVRNIYILFSKGEIPIADTEDQEIMDLVEPGTPLPPWFTEDDLQAYAELYEKSGFKFPLQMPYREKALKKYGSFGRPHPSQGTINPSHGFRSMNGMMQLEDPKIKVPAMLIMGEKDYCLKFPGMEDYIRSGVVKHFVPDLEVLFMPEGSHFVHEQFPDEVNGLIIPFLNKHI